MKNKTSEKNLQADFKRESIVIYKRKKYIIKIAHDTFRGAYSFYVNDNFSLAIGFDKIKSENDLKKSIEKSIERIISEELEIKKAKSDKLISNNILYNWNGKL